MANQSLVRYVNERLILTLLRVEGELTRADIARRLSLTRASITHLVDGLIARRLLREAEQRPSAGSRRRDLGRPGIHVGLDPTGGYFLGVEIGVGTMRFALLDLSMTLVEERALRTSPSLGAEDAVTEVARFLAELEAKADYRGMIRGGGVTVPGLVRSDGFVVHLPILGWRDVNLARMLGERLDVPILVENNANAAAFGEAYVFPRERYDHIVFLKLGTGCGGAVIADGRILRGASGMAAEFGHIRVGETGPRCNCGRLGCLEPRVNLSALRRSLGCGDDVDPVTAVPPAWRRGDPRAVEAMEELSRALSLGLVTLANAFNPDEIVLGGAMRPVLELVIDTLQEKLAREAVPGMLVPKVSLSRLGEMHCAIGAAAIAHHEASDISHVGLATFG
jgi:N-acetylglucosamine repressor